MFSDYVSKQLNNYVYRLIDPRTGVTFYVGRGKGNRVFAHVNDLLSNYNGVNYLLEDEEDDISTAKLRTIREIKSKNLQVIHLIHRWGLTESEAKEVEAALIDAYPGLDNIIGGYDRDRSLITALN